MPPFSNMRIRRLALLVALLGFVAISSLAALFTSFPGDEEAIIRFQRLRSSTLDDAACGASFLADLPVAVGSVFGLSALLWLGRRKTYAVAVLLVLLPEGLNQGLKELVGRPRPEFSILASEQGTMAFTSGHALHAILLFGLLIVILEELVRCLWWRRAAQVILGLAILVCGASRVYMGVHWPSDVLGAYLLGALSLAAILWLRKRLINAGMQ